MERRGVLCRGIRRYKERRNWIRGGEIKREDRRICAWMKCIDIREGGEIKKWVKGVRRDSVSY